MYKVLFSKDAVGQWKDQKIEYRLGKIWDEEKAKEVYALLCKVTTWGHGLREKRVGFFKKQVVKTNGKPFTHEYVKATGDKAWARRTAKRYKVDVP